jgi:Endonuclease/Exonuclease/phosphatase family
VSEGTGATPPSEAPQPAVPPRLTPSRARKARKRARGCDYIGTRNVRDLGSANSLGRLAALAQLMSESGVGVLAIQESELNGSQRQPEQVGLVYRGSAARRTAHGGRRGGVGFLVREDVVPFFTFLGSRGGRTAPSNEFAAQWARVYGASTDQDLWVASVYLPDASRRREDPRLFDKALADVSADVAFYEMKPGTVVVMGDWNARQGNSQMPGMPDDLRAYAPVYGEPRKNPEGLKVLRMCRDAGLGVRSGAWPEGSGPTCVGHGRRAAVQIPLPFVTVPRTRADSAPVDAHAPRLHALPAALPHDTSVLADIDEEGGRECTTGTSVVDHIMTSISSATASRPPVCFALDVVLDKPELDCIGSDHVFFPSCPPALPHAHGLESTPP